MATKIFNLTLQECKKIYPELAKNGDSLLLVSKLARDKNKIGIAISLSILSFEEYTKAIILLLKAYNVRVFQVKELIQAFSDHKKKHQTASLIELLNLVEPIIKFQEWNENRKQRRKLPFKEKFLVNLQDFASALEPLGQIFSNIAWLENANELKNRGFYVDYSDRLLNPDELNIKEFEEAQSVLSRIKRSYRILNIALNRLPEKETKKLINTLNQGIDTYNKKNK